MTFTEQEVQWIVAEVIRRLEIAGVVVAGAWVAVGGAADHGDRGVQPWFAARPTATPGELVLPEKVITMRTIEGRLAGVNRLRVPAKAVITPAVRDALKDRHVELVRQ